MGGSSGEVVVPFRGSRTRAPITPCRGDVHLGQGLLGSAQPCWVLCYRVARAARVPAAAPMRSHLAARARRCKVLPPLAVRTASSRSLIRVAVFDFSSARSDWVAASLAWQALQSRAKSYRGFRSAVGITACGSGATGLPEFSFCRASPSFFSVEDWFALVGGRVARGRHRDWLWQRDLLRNRLKDLLRSLDFAFLRCKSCQRAEEIGVSGLLAVGGLGQGLLSGGEFGGKFGAVGAFGAPSDEQRCGEDRADGESR